VHAPEKVRMGGLAGAVWQHAACVPDAPPPRWPAKATCSLSLPRGAPGGCCPALQPSAALRPPSAAAAWARLRPLTWCTAVGRATTSPCCERGGCHLPLWGCVLHEAASTSDWRRWRTPPSKLPALAAALPVLRLRPSAFTSNRPSRLAAPWPPPCRCAVMH
jgi:hypothetical protein